MTRYTTYIKAHDGIVMGAVGDSGSNSRQTITPAGVLTQNNMRADYGMVQLQQVQAMQGAGSIYFRIPISSGGDPAGATTYSGCQIKDFIVMTEAGTDTISANIYLIADPTLAPSATNGIQLANWSTGATAPGKTVSVVGSTTGWNGGTTPATTATQASQYIQNTCFNNAYGYVRVDISGTTNWQHYTLTYAVRYFYG